MTDGLDESEHRSALYISAGALRYDFGPRHPLQSVRLRAMLDLIAELGLTDDAHSPREPLPATLDELRLVHSDGYLQTVQSLSDARFPLRGADTALAESRGLGVGDTPAFAGMHEASSLVAGATIAAVRAVLTDDLAHAFSPSGGLHHAMQERASGFCVYNDVSAGIAIALREHDARVLYLDFDAHHGDGVQAAFYDEPRVLTVSFHESGRYLFPGTGGIDERGVDRGFGYAVNVPLQPFTQDESWLEAVNAVVPILCRAYRPTLMVSQHGCDGHVWDPLTHLAITSAAFAAQTALVHRLAHELCGGRWVACGGGGYQPLRVVPRAWTSLWAEMCGARLAGSLPRPWLERWSEQSSEPLPETFVDPADAYPEVARRSRIDSENRATVRETLESRPW